MPIGCCPSRSSSWFAIAINAAHNGAARLVPPPICQNWPESYCGTAFGGRAHIRYLALRAVAVERIARQPALPRRPVLGKPSRPPATVRPRALRGRRSIPCRPKDRASDGQHVRAVRGTEPRVTRVSRRPRAHDRRRAASSAEPAKHVQGLIQARVAVPAPAAGEDVSFLPVDEMGDQKFGSGRLKDVDRGGRGDRVRPFGRRVRPPSRRRSAGGFRAARSSAGSTATVRPGQRTVAADRSAR